jgi:hypothetical protein
VIFLATSWKLILEPPRDSSGVGERTVVSERRESQRDAVGAGSEERDPVSAGTNRATLQSPAPPPSSRHPRTPTY